MAVVTVSPKYHVTIPHSLREELGLHAGDRLDAKVEGGKITLTRSLPARVAESLADFKSGHAHGPYKNAGEAVASIERELRKRALRAMNIVCMTLRLTRNSFRQPTRAES